MILVAKEQGSRELLPLIKCLGKKAELYSLAYGDFVFEGNGPKGRISIAVERKTLHDMLNCIDDARFSAHQKVGMRMMYNRSYLAMEGLWRPHEPEEWLMEGFVNKRGETSWTFCRYRSQRTHYSKLRHYLFSVALGGVEILYTRDPWQTAVDVCGMYDYFQKPWNSHTSLLECQLLNLPDLRGKPTLVRRWAADLEGIGVKHSLDAERLFKTPIALANSEETDWMKIKGIGAPTAQKIIREIQGWKKH